MFKLKSSPKFLIVEDSFMVATQIKFILKKGGYMNVDIVPGCQEALKSIQTRNYPVN